MLNLREKYAPGQGERENGHMAIAQAHLNARANVKATDNNGDTLLRLATRLNDTDIVEFLRDAGATE